MKAFRLYIKDFMCHEKSFIDFTQFSSALIVGKVDSNDMHSNGVGKSTIFSAMEYVLFNQADINLERIIRDDTNSCAVVFDFMVGQQEYRISRTRTKKGSTDLSLYQRTAKIGSVEEMYHDVNQSPVTQEQFWKDISGRRAADTEKELAKLIKINFKSFRVFVHFMQNDFEGLTTATPEKRKGILRDALNLVLYSKMEKIAKDQYNSILKDLDRQQVLLQSLGDPNQDLIDLAGKLSLAETELMTRRHGLISLNELVSLINQKINDLTNTHANLTSKFSALVVKEKTLLNEKSKIETSVKEYQTKKTNTIKAAKELIEELAQLQNSQTKLASLDYSKIDILTADIGEKREQIAQHNLIVQTNASKYEELKVPLPDDSVCKHCRQQLTREHKKICRQQIDQELVACQENIQNSRKTIAQLNSEVLAHLQTINSLNLSKQQLETINTNITVKNKEIVDRRTWHEEYSTNLTRYTADLKEKNKEIEQAQEDLRNSSSDEAKGVQLQIEAEKQNISGLMLKTSSLNKEITHYSSNKAIIQHTIDQKTKEKLKKEELQKSISKMDSKIEMYPLVIQAFSSVGIPNLIIQNVLDELQVEANGLLAQLKPGLQLSFFIEKTKGDGTEADTLDINYQINGRDRYYKQLSGAQKLAVTFSLKLGLSFLLQKMLGVNIEFLLLDELDQSLDKASVDAFANIIKFFQKDFTILVITHNDRLKDKFSHAVLVDQDINLVSRAQVVSSW
jgi:DNA repair exonuclease SbcCD ATPase subunit